MEKEIFKVAIPSYKRCESQTTLDLFERAGVEKENIFIFVQTEEDYKTYSEKYGARANVIFKEANGIAKARNNILNYFNSEHNILMCDDDIKRIGTTLTGNFNPVEDKDIIKEINRCFTVTGTLKGNLFGIYPVYNDFFMSRTISTRVSVNTVIGFLKGFTERMDETYPAKEDIELCSRLLYNGKKVIRFNYLSVDAKHRTNKGGCNDTWESNANIEVSKRLATEYKGIVEVNRSKPSEIRMVIKDKKIKL